MMSVKPIQIVGFTPLGVILAERLSYSSTDVSLVEQTSNVSIDTPWQSVSLLCLINILKQCRMLLSNTSKKFGLHVQSVKINEELIYAYLKLTTEHIQKYYFTLLKQRQVKFELFTEQMKNDERVKASSLNVYESIDDEEIESKDLYHSVERLLKNDDFQLTSKTPWKKYFLPSRRSVTDENCTKYITFSHSSHPEFAQSPRLNAFHAIFQYLLQYPSLKLIGPDLFTFELAHLLVSLGHNQIYLYRMNPNESSILPITSTNATLASLFQVFSKFIHEPLIQTVSDENHRSTLHIIEQFHEFRINVDAGGKLEYKKLIEPIMPIGRTPNETKKIKRTYLETFRQSAHESTIKLATSNIPTGIEYFVISICKDSSISDDNNKINEEPLDRFPPSSTFLVLTDVTTLSDTKSRSHLSSPPPFPKAIRTFNNTPGSLIFNIYETLRTISGDSTTPHLTNIFLSVDHELCVLQNPISGLSTNLVSVIMFLNHSSSKWRFRCRQNH